MPANAALYYTRVDFDNRGADQPKGRLSANEGFLEAFLAHAGVEEFACLAPNRADAQHFADRVLKGTGKTRTAWIGPTAHEPLGKIGTLFYMSPGLAPWAWRRRRYLPRAYSLVGITYTISSPVVLDALAAMPAAPIEPWDALVCISEDGMKSARTVLTAQADYLRERLGATRPSLPQLPVIPFGVDAKALAALRLRRERARARFDLAEGEIAVLALGRLTPFDKANPLPLFLAVEEAAKRTSKPLRLILVGRAPDAKTHQAFAQAAATIAPSARPGLFDGQAEGMIDEAWAAADIFLSLPDNHQETLGLTPIEAMAAGIPVVGADWDGYRMSVRPGIDGFLVPVRAAMPGSGGDLAIRLEAGIDNVFQSLGQASQFVAVDVAAAAEALIRLAEDADLRARLGQAGQARAKAEFDWPRIVAAHQKLWGALAEIRQTAPPEPAIDPANVHPARPDPFRMFASYPTETLAPAMRIAPGPAFAPERRRLILESPLANFIDPALLPTPEETARALAVIAQAGTTNIGTVAALVEPSRRALLARGLLRLAKFGILRIESAP